MPYPKSNLINFILYFAQFFRFNKTIYFITEWIIIEKQKLREKEVMDKLCWFSINRIENFI